MKDLIIKTYPDEEIRARDVARVGGNCCSINKYRFRTPGGKLVLSPEHARLLGEWLIAYAEEQGK